MKRYRMQIVSGMLSGLAGVVVMLAAEQAGQAQALNLPSATSEPVTANPMQKDDLSQILETPKAELDELIKKSVLTRLTAERQQVANEIRDDLLFNDANGEKDAAIKVINDNPSNTQKDNIERICKAFALVDEGFAGAYKLYTDGKYAEAADAFRKIVNVKEVRYFSAAKSYLLGDSLYRQGLAGLGDPAKDFASRKLIWDAYDAYQDLLQSMPDRVSFSASAALNSALACDKLDRGFYALEMYVFCIKNFALTLDRDQVQAIVEKAKQLQDIYADPMASVTKMMGDVKTRLDNIDSGKETQDTEKKVVALLDDLIKTTQEKDQQQNQNPSSSKSRKKGAGQGEGESEGQSQDQSQGKSGKADRTNKPGSGAKTSALPDGAAGRKPPLSEVRETGEKGDWAELAPREREKIEAAKKAVMSERYRAIIGDYFERLAAEKSANKESTAKEQP